MIEREILINAPIDKVFKVIRDFESYPEFLSTTHSAKEKKLKNKIVVDFSVEVIKSIHYSLEFKVTEPTEVSWTFLKGDLMKKNSGSWELEAVSDKKTKALYKIDIDFGWMVPKMIIDQVTKTQLPQTLEAFKKRAENLS
ncbi:MAG: SRPBCC family protein [Deltaproteobacteria bacterium]|nr:SRPBCC family protein [Deltaproteobacteria bacterium]